MIYNKRKSIIARLIIILLLTVILCGTVFFYIQRGDFFTNTGLPVVKITTEKDSNGNYTEILRDTWINATVEIIDTTGETIFDFIQIKGRGNSTWTRMPKKGYSIKFNDEHEVLGMPKDKRWELLASYSDKTLMRTAIAFDLAEDMGMKYSARNRFVDVYLNDELMGNYTLIEKIKVSGNRLDIQKQTAESENITGGYLLEIDMDSRIQDNYKYFYTQYINKDNYLYIYEDGELLPTAVSVKYPEPEYITDEQFEYIKQYVLDAETALFSDNFTDPELGYAKYFDVDSLVDWYIFNEITKSVDSPMLTSVYLYKDVDSKLCMGPVWDFDLSMGNSGMRLGYLTEGLYVGKAPWFARLLEDPAFLEKIAERWDELKDTAMKNIFTNIDKYYAEIYLSQKINFRIWPILGKWVWPERDDIEPLKNYKAEVEYLREFLTKRIAWFDETFGKK